MSGFVFIHGPIASLFNFHRNDLTDADHRDICAVAMAGWSEIALSAAV
jgi:putative transposase